MTNCVITDANRGINMTIRDGGNVNNVLFSNIVINTRRKQTFWWGNGDPVWLTTQQGGGEILIQGDRRQDVASLLRNIGYKVNI